MFHTGRIPACRYRASETARVVSCLLILCVIADKCLLQMTEVAGGPGSGGVPTTANIVKEGWLFKRGEFHRYIVSVLANAACSLGESEKSQHNLLYNSY